MTTERDVSSEVLRVSFEIPYKEHVRAMRALLHRRWTTWFGYFFFIGLSFAMGIVETAMIGSGATPAGVLIASTGGLLIAGLIYAVPWVLVRQARKDLPVYGGPIVYSFSDEGIHVKAQQFSAEYSWSLVGEVAQTREFIFLCVSKQSALVVPKRALSSDREFWNGIHRWAPRLTSKVDGPHNHTA